MAPKLWMVEFDYEELRESLLNARKFLNALPETASVERHENVAIAGFVYVRVAADRTSIDEAGLHLCTGVSLAAVGAAAEECLNCGNVADRQHAVCPACQHREIAPCPKCGTDVPRTEYVPAEGNLVHCPHCRTRVRLRWAAPLWTESGFYVEPIIHVAGVRVRLTGDAAALSGI